MMEPGDVFGSASGDSDLTLGIDLGTQSVRAVLLDEAGAVVRSHGAPLASLYFDGTRHEQDPGVWWETVGGVVRRLTNDLEREVAGLAICSTSGTVLLSDPAGRPLTPAVMYDDGRACEEARVAQEAGGGLWDSLGYGMQSSFALPKLLWMLRKTRGVSRVMHCADYIAARLCGEMVATDWSHALKTGYDLASGRWPLEVFDSLGVPAKVLPQVVRPGTIIGEVSREAEGHTGIPAGTPVRAGMTDSCAAQISSGVLEPGRWNSVLGTTLALKGVSRELLYDPSGMVYSHRHPDGGWLPGGASSCGAGVIAALFPDADLDALDEAAARRGPSSAVFYPLTSRGERFPFAAPEAERFWLGEPEDEADRFRAVLEGVAFVERLCFSHVRGLGAEVRGPVSATGGGTRSRVWSQLRSNVLGAPVVVPLRAEGAVGMAILARAGDGSVTEAAGRMSRPGWRFEPERGEDDRLAENFERLLSGLVKRGYLHEDLARRAAMA